jgi:hypothetical protein
MYRVDSDDSEVDENYSDISENDDGKSDLTDCDDYSIGDVNNEITKIINDESTLVYENRLQNSLLQQNNRIQTSPSIDYDNMYLTNSTRRPIYDFVGSFDLFSNITG